MSAINCAGCARKIIRVSTVKRDDRNTRHPIWTAIVYPRWASRPIPAEVEGSFGAVFQEANAVLADSPRASAALSRRLVQQIIREKAGITRRDLATELEDLLKTGVPSYLADAVDGVRHIGNFAAHPIKSTNTGEIVDVEPGEAEWLLDVVEGLFDFYFVQPAILARKRDELNKKLAEAGKPPMKSGT